MTTQQTINKNNAAAERTLLSSNWIAGRIYSSVSMVCRGCHNVIQVALIGGTRTHCEDCINHMVAVADLKTTLQVTRKRNAELLNAMIERESTARYIIACNTQQARYSKDLEPVLVARHAMA